MAKYTNMLNLKKPDLEDFFDVSDQNGNMDIIDSAIEGLSQLAKSVGTSNAIELSVSHLKSYSNCLKISFVASANNNGTATTVNVNQWGTKNLYKPNTTTAPVLIACKAYDIWFDEASDCFFLKASAEGDATAAHVLAGKTFSNDDESGVVGTIPSKEESTIFPGTVDQSISSGQYLSGEQIIKGDPGLIASNIRYNVDLFGVVGSLIEGRRSTLGSIEVDMFPGTRKNYRIDTQFEPFAIIVWTQSSGSVGTVVFKIDGRVRGKEAELFPYNGFAATMLESYKSSIDMTGVNLSIRNKNTSVRHQFRLDFIVIGI